MDGEGRVFGYGYDETLLLPFRIVAPDDARPGAIEGIELGVRWLTCHEQDCVEGGSSLSLNVEVAASAEPSATADDPAGLSLPESAYQWRFDASTDGGEIRLQIIAPEVIDDLYFFPVEPVIWHADPQTVTRVSSTEHQLSVQADPFYQGDRSRLSGVLAFTDGEGAYRGVSVALPLEAQSPSSEAAAPATPQGGGWNALLLAFLGGLILNLMPCVLPVLSLKAIALARSASLTPAAMRADGWAYAAGVLSCFGLIGLAVLIGRSVMPAASWGSQLQNPVVVMGLALLMTGVGLNLLGVLKLGGSLQRLGGALQTRQGLRGAFLTGMLAVLVAAPCTAPFMASALGYAMIASPLGALAVFVSLGGGLALPYLVITHAPATQRLLPKPGPWMQALQQVLAFPMFVTAIWLLWVLGAQTSHDGMAIGLLACLALAAAAKALSHGGRVGQTLGASLIVLGASSVLPLAWLSDASASAELVESRQEEDFSRQALGSLLADDQKVFLYFTADWCITCKVNEATALRTQATLDHFERNDIRLMVGDWTREDPEISRFIAEYGRAGVPLYLYFERGAGIDEGVILPQVLTEEIIRQHTTQSLQGAEAGQ
jgi:thiol:disulfide interchange protein DsbD